MHSLHSELLTPTQSMVLLLHENLGRRCSFTSTSATRNMLLNASFRCSHYKAVQNTPTDTLIGILNSSASLQALNSASVWKQEDSLLCLFFFFKLRFFFSAQKFPQYLHLPKVRGALGNYCCHYETCRLLHCSSCSSTFLLLEEHPNGWIQWP